MKAKLYSYHLTPNQTNIGVLQLIKRFNSEIKFNLRLTLAILGFKVWVSTKRGQTSNKIPPSNITKDDTVKIITETPNYTIVLKTCLHTTTVVVQPLRILAPALHLHPSDIGRYCTWVLCISNVQFWRKNSWR